MDASQRLSQINHAIEAIENGAQEYQIGSKRVIKADLATLYRERQNIKQEVINENNNGGVYVACFDRR